VKAVRTTDYLRLALYKNGGMPLEEGYLFFLDGGGKAV
jgi:hypothetical protein